MAEQQMNLYQKLAKIRAMSDVVRKDKKGYNYNYADVTAILANITAGMKKHRVSLIPSINPNTSRVEKVVSKNTKFDKTGKPFESTSTEMLYSADMIFTWVDDDNPEDKISVPWFVVGSQSDPSQALGAGLTYCMRYFLCNYFQIAQPDDDVDAYRSKQKLAEKSEDRAIAGEIISQLDKLVREYLKSNPDRQEEIKTFVGKYVKNSDYFKITEPAIASKLLQDFTTKYLNTKKESE